MRRKQKKPDKNKEILTPEHLKSKEEKEEKLRSAAPSTVLRFLLWGILLFLLVRGIVSIFTADSIDKQRVKVENFITQTEQEEASKSRAMAFAEEFLQEYFTYDAQNDGTYEKSMQAYLAKGLTLHVPGNTKLTALQVKAIQATYAADGIINVEASVMVQYEKKTKILMILMPVYVDGRGCAAAGLPQLIPKDETPETYAYTAELGGSVSESKKEEIEDVVDSFLKTYCSGNENELHYYVTDDFPYSKGLNAILDYGGLEKIRIGASEDSSRYFVQADAVLQDEGLQISQTYYINIVQSDRLYIEDISTVLN